MPGLAAAALGLLVEVGRHVPAPEVERRDQGASGEGAHAVEAAEAEPGPGEVRRRRCRRVGEPEDRRTARAARPRSPVMIHWARAVTVMPAITRPTMTRNQKAPTRVASAVLFAAESLNSESVSEPAGSAPATMKMVAETTSDQPLRNPSDGMQRPADPGVAGAGVDVGPAQVVERPGDAEHRDARSRAAPRGWPIRRRRSARPSSPRWSRPARCRPPPSRSSRGRPGLPGAARVRYWSSHTPGWEPGSTGPAGRIRTGRCAGPCAPGRAPGPPGRRPSLRR